MLVQHVAWRCARPDERRKPGAAGNVLRRHSGAFADVLARAGADRIRRPHLDPVAVAAGAAPGAGHARRADLELRDGARAHRGSPDGRSEEHTSELQSLMRISYAVFCLKKKNTHINMLRS